MRDWAPAHEAMYPAVSSSLPTRPPSPSNLVPPDQAQNHSRLRSMSVSLPWRQRPKSAFFGSAHNNASTSSYNLPLESSKSHGFGALFDQQHTHTQNDPAALSSKHTHHRDSHLGLKRTLRRMSVSLKEGVMGLMHRRTSVPAGTTFDSDGHAVRSHLKPHGHSSARPTTSHSAWHRLRHAASFHYRHSRVLHTDYSDRMFEHDLSTIDSQTLPIPGSAEHPPIIPRKTGAAARQAAAIACSGMHGYDVMDVPPVPRPGWLSDDAFDDHESGIGIALTSSEIEAYVPCDGIDSDVDVGASLARDESPIIKVDFISQLPLELSIQILALLDAQTLITASRVCRRWHFVIQNQHIWRESFLREKTQTYATSGPVKPGAGLGVPPIQPSNNWKEIYRVKTELDKRWKEGKARPVYLNGHTDSIYCLQFDEYALSPFTPLLLRCSDLTSTGRKSLQALVIAPSASGTCTPSPASSSSALPKSLTTAPTTCSTTSTASPSTMPRSMILTALAAPSRPTIRSLHSTLPRCTTMPLFSACSTTIASW